LKTIAGLAGVASSSRTVETMLSAIPTTEPNSLKTGQPLEPGAKSAVIDIIVASPVSFWPVK